MMNVKRYDRAELRGSPVRTSQDFLLCSAYLSRAGVFEYRTPDGKTRYEFRPPEEVFSAESMASFSLAPLTLHHPPVEVSSSNVKSYGVGIVGETVEQDGQFLAGTVLVQAADAIKSVESGETVELSCGYTCDLEETPGEYEGIKYDAVQRNIRGNHVALVDEGRAGPDVRLHLDSADAVMVGTPTQSKRRDSTAEVLNMEKIVINGVEYEVSPQVAQAFKAFMEKENAEKVATDEEQKKLTDELAAAEKEKEQAQAKADAAEARATAAEKARADAADPARVQELVRARVALERTAAPILGAAVTLDSMDDLAIKRAVVEKVRAGIKLDSKSDTYVEAAYDLAVQDHANATNPLARLRSNVTPAPRADGVPATREDRFARYAKQAQAPLAASK